jgi:hypothetical protein
MSSHHEHEAIKRLIGRDPTFVVELLKFAGAEVPEHDSVRMEHINLDELIPDECGADAVVSFAAGRRTVWAVAINVQLARDDAVHYTWPVHLTTLIARLEARAVLIVICPDPDVAQWAAKPIVMGPGCELRPLVFGPDHVAHLPAAARRYLESWSTSQNPGDLSEFFRHVIEDGDARSIRAFLAAYAVDVPDGLRASVTARRHGQLQTWT